MLCGLAPTIFSASVGATLRVLLCLLLQIVSVLRVRASLPPGAEDEIILIEHLPGRRVHLQDFFWTGADDAPPWIDPEQGLTFYESRTHHTVTVYPPDAGVPTPRRPGQQPGPYDPECKTCLEPTPRLDDDDAEQDIGILIGEDPGPRYWLLTVLRAGEAVPPKVELRLARLYRAAFSRQQQRHLGLLSTDPRSRREAKRRGHLDRKSPLTPNRGIHESSKLSKSPKTSPKSNVESTSETDTSAQASTELPIKIIQMVEIPKTRRVLHLKLDPESSTEEEDESEESSMEMNPEALPLFQAPLTEPTQPSSTDSINNVESTTESTTESDKTSNSTYEKINLRPVKNIPMKSVPLQESKEGREQDEKDDHQSGTRSKLRSLDQSVQGIVQVRMQNTSVTEGGATRLIYSVHLGGKPVPAESAARDMALLSPQEVALELGAPVIVQSEPYLKETRPLALSRKRDVWVFVGAAGAAVVLLAFILAGLVIAAKRKRAHSAVVAPPSRSILKKEREYVTTIPGLDNAGFSTSETEVKSLARSQTDGTSQRQTPGSLSRTPITADSPDSRDEGIHQVSSDEDEDAKRKVGRGSSPWSVQEQSQKRSRISQHRMTRTNAMDPPRTPDSMDTVVDRLETVESPQPEYPRREEATASPHSYLSMPSCKQFPNMRSVEPLSRVLEPVMVKHLDIDSPELGRHGNGEYEGRRINVGTDKYFARSASAMKDPGVIGPIVWNLRQQGASGEEGNGTSETDVDPASMVPPGPVGRARRRLHELLEDSFSLFGSREPKIKETYRPSRPTSAAHSPDAVTVLSETRGKSAHVSPVTGTTSDLKTRPQTSIPRKYLDQEIPEAKPSHPRGAWGSRPLSAGPFHRPNLPEIDTRRILADAHLPPEDPAVPLIATIKKELEKFSSQ